MKKTFLLALFALIMSAPLFSQVIRFDIDVKYSKDAADRTADIVVYVTSGKPEFTYFLMTNDPIHGTVLVKSEPVRKSKYVFKHVKPGKYFLKIEDATGGQAGKTVNVTEN